MGILEGPNGQTKMQSLWANAISADLWLDVIKSTKCEMSMFKRDLKEGIYLNSALCIWNIYIATV